MDFGVIVLLGGIFMLVAAWWMRRKILSRTETITADHMGLYSTDSKTDTLIALYELIAPMGIGVFLIGVVLVVLAP